MSKPLIEVFASDGTAPEDMGTVLGRLLAARRRFEPKEQTCARCGSKFEGGRRRLYCTPTCRELAYRDRHPKPEPKRPGRPRKPKPAAPSGTE